MNSQQLTLDEFTNEAENFISNLVPNTTSATILALHGDLGAGKTTFTQIIAKKLGVEENIVSPTFLIQKRYPLSTLKTKLGTPTSKWKKLVHIDAYRLEDKEQLMVLDWKELIDDSKNLIIIEWPENVEGVLPKETKNIYFEFINEEERRISY